MGENMKNFILRSKISILQLALYLISITMSKAKHPANMVLLTASEHFLLKFNIAHICPISKIFSISSLTEGFRYTGSDLRVRVSPFYFSIFADVSIFTCNFYRFSRGKPSSTRTTKTGKSNTNFLTHREAVSIFIKLELHLLLNCFFRNN